MNARARRGLSPLVRGNPVRRGHAGRLAGTIPARAGEPMRPRARCCPPRDYPRSCGGTATSPSRPRPIQGLSPLVRGNHIHDAVHVVPRGTIPARAGEPPIAALEEIPARDYPRSCGGTSAGLRIDAGRRGLSPLVRGNRWPPRPSGASPRTIPARAGEPLAASAVWSIPEDYPRSCGGTAPPMHRQRSRQGLSPLVRGNRSRSGSTGGGERTIPARAGEPHPPCPPTHPSRDYPRSCGGTRGLLRPVLTLLGLSPLVRGNPDGAGEREPPPGTIPARAGEPKSQCAGFSKAGDYPRSCGGTDVPGDIRGDEDGLSPLVRGNLRGVGSDDVGNGTIPARAGEPARGQCESEGGRGLSPLVRGNHLRAEVRSLPPGTIPARAGEPHPSGNPMRRSQDYPRSCGGTTS